MIMQKSNSEEVNTRAENKFFSQWLLQNADGKHLAKAISKKQT
jgi:hypothetical protein